MSFADRWTVELLTRAGDPTGRLHREVLARTYAPSPLRRYKLRVGDKVRDIGEPAPRDRVVMDAWRALADPDLEARLAPHVWGYRVGRDRHGAVASLAVPLPRIFTLLRCDVSAMFDSLDHGVLMRALGWAWPVRGSRGGAPRGGPPWGALQLGGVPWGARAWEALPWGGPPWASVPWGTSAVRPTTPAQGAAEADELCAWLVGRWLRAWQSGVGVPTGTSVSPALSNAYFGATIDPWIVSELRRGRIAAAVRYADDFALLVPGDGVQALAGIEQVLAGAELRLNPSKTRMHRADGPWPATVLGVDLAPSGGRLRGCV